MIERRPRTLRRAVLLLVVLAVMVGTAVAGRAQSKWRLEPGDTVPVLVGADTAGDPITFDFKAQRLPTIVYSIAPFSKCVVANEKRFASLLKQTRGRFNVVVMVPEHSERTAECVSGVMKCPGFIGERLV